MKNSRRPLEVHETRALLQQRIEQVAPIVDQYSAQERSEAMARTPMGANPEHYIDTYFLSRQPIGGQRP